MIRQLINGASEAPLSILDRGLHYGDGLFETMLVANSKIIHLVDHLYRLRDGCRRLNISTPSSETLVSECALLLGDVKEGVIKIIVTRGDATRGYRYADNQVANRILILYPPVHYAEQNWRCGITLRVCQTRLGSNRQLAGIKHLNRLEQVMARAEWNDDDIAEGIMLDAAGNVIEATMSNVFMVENEQLMTPDLSECGVAGIMRKNVIDSAQTLQIPLKIENIPLQRLVCADEVFICNSIIGIWPVIAIAKQGFELGPITSKLMNLLKVLPSA